MKSIEAYWESRNPVAIILTPVSWFFCLVVWLRRLLYKSGVLAVYRAPVPVLVVGNITVGGTGKTPLVVWLVELLMNLGYRPGIVSRGYRGKSATWPRSVDWNSDPLEVGDEPVLLARRTRCPVCVGPDRPAAAKWLIEQAGCDFIVSDDGLQHYALARDLEIAVVDGERRLGNGLCLPAGPLRERASRLTTVDLIIANGVGRDGEHAMKLSATAAVNLQDAGLNRALEDFIGGPVHAVAGIGNPARFFKTLRQKGLDVIEHPFPDHHDFRFADIFFKDEFPVLMTEKDAVKCARFAKVSHWFLKVDADPDSNFTNRFTQLLRDIANG
jgi:tetraacyldisaccharide 4'-kinase